MAASLIFGPIPYRQRSDSPFYRGIQEGTIVLEDFEDGELNTPGVAISNNGRILRDRSVDEDDGTLDVMGTGSVWVATQGYVPELGEPWFHEITFSPDTERGYPTYVGFALLGYSKPPQAMVQRLYRGYDGAGTDFTGIVAFDVPHLPAGTLFYSTVGDQFAGIYNDQGISRVIIGGFARTLDHLQYGWAIPEPGTVTLTGAAVALLLAQRRRDKSVA